MEHAEAFHQQGVPFIFDPGQGLPMFNGEELLRITDWAHYITLNDYEARLFEDRTGLNLTTIAARVKALIVTKGSQGSLIYAEGQCHEIPPAKPTSTQDPTGCGDAYRAGLVQGLLEGRDLPTAGRMASLMGAIKVESAGTQNHSVTLPGFKTRFRETFGVSLD